MNLKFRKIPIISGANYMRTFKFTFLAILCLITLMFSGCGSDKKPESAKETQSKSNSIKASDTGKYSQKYKFKNAESKEILVVKMYAAKQKIELNENGSVLTLQCKKSQSGKSKYKTEDKKVICVVKSKSGSFKLSNEAGALLWKVKIKPQKIKISNNEEGNNPFVIKFKSAEKAKIYDNNSTQIGKVKFYSGKGKLKVKDSSEKEMFSCKVSKLLPSAGVLMYKSIPLEQRAAIITELLKLGK